MTFILKYGKRLVFTIISIFILMLILTCFYYYDYISEDTYNFFKFWILMFSIFGNSFILGKQSSKKGYIEGVRFGSLIIIILFISTLIFFKFRLRYLFYYIIILMISVLGSIIGINRKKVSS